MEISQNQCILKAEFRFGIFGFGSANLTEISVSVVSVFTRFGRPLKLSKYYSGICMELFLFTHFQVKRCNNLHKQQAKSSLN